MTLQSQITEPDRNQKVNRRVEIVEELDLVVIHQGGDRDLSFITCVNLYCFTSTVFNRLFFS